MPVAVAPFFNAINTYLPGWQDAAGYGETWRHILEFADIDVVALQDGVGAGHATPSTLAPWFSAMKQAISDAGSPAVLIADTETYIIGAAELQPMASRDIVTAINAVRPYVSGYWAFSFNHYQSPRSASRSVPTTRRTGCGRARTLKIREPSTVDSTCRHPAMIQTPRTEKHWSARTGTDPSKNSGSLSDHVPDPEGLATKDG